MSARTRPGALRELVALACLLGCATLLPGCWRKSNLVVQEEATAYLRLVGDVTGVVVELDSSGTRQALPLEDQEEQGLLLLEVLPGRHLVELYRGNERILRREVYCSLGQVVEIAVPR